MIIQIALYQELLTLDYTIQHKSHLCMYILQAYMETRTIGQSHTPLYA